MVTCVICSRRCDLPHVRKRLVIAIVIHGESEVFRLFFLPYTNIVNSVYSAVANIRFHFVKCKVVFSCKTS